MNVLEAHGFRCYYSQRSLNMFNATIDHIIPQSYEGKLDELEEYKKKLGHDIDINDLINLVPATWEINVLKGNKLYDIPHAIFIMNRAKEKAPVILKRIEELRNFKDFEKYLAMISTYISNSNDPKQELSKITELLPAQFGPFDKKRAVSDDHFSRSESFISLMAFLPKLYEQCGSCCFEFRSIFVSDCMITLSHREILERLFVGLNTDYKLEMRGFLVGQHYNIANLYYVQLGNNRFTLKDSEVEQLCEIVDDFGQVYKEKFYKIEKKWDTINFINFDPYEYSVRLVEVERSLWRKMIEFSWEFDYANGNTEWHIFNKTTGTIMIYPNRVILARLEPEKTESYHYASYLNSDDTLWIKWKRYDNRFEKTEEPWSAAQTYHWLCQKFIPYVIYYYEYVKSKKYGIMKSPTFDDFMKNFKIDDLIISSSLQTKKSIEQIENVEELLSEMYSLQMFFNSSPPISVSLEEIKSVYLGIKYILMNIELPNYSSHYIQKQINYLSDEECLQDDPIALINSKMENVDEDDVNAGHIAELFKCYIEALKCENALRNLKKPVINEIKKLLNPIWEKHKLVKYFERIGNVG
jgi:hypothetical protein